MGVLGQPLWQTIPVSIETETVVSAKRKLTMRELRQMLRSAEEDLSPGEIGRRLGLARSTVQGNPCPRPGSWPVLAAAGGAER